MTKLSFVSFAGVFVLGSVAFGQQFEATPEHAILKKDLGSWDAEMKIWAEGQSPLEAKGVEVNQAVGDLWVTSRFDAEIFGQKFAGSGTFGYDVSRKKYVGTWIDSSSPYVSHMEGSYDKTSNTLTMTTRGKDPSGQEMEGKNTMRYVDENTRIFTMYNKQGDKYVKVIEITYKRKK